MDNPKVSIITPTYNHEKFINRCIESVLSQSYPNWEQIIIDDGSNDNTSNLIASYKDKRIKCVKQHHKGIWKLNENYNKALKYCTGEIIAILEGDDFWPCYKLEKQISAFKDPEVILSWGKAIITNSNDDAIGYYPNSFDKFKNLSSEEMFTNLFFGNFISACTVMCRKSNLIQINGFRQPLNVPFVDYPTWLNIGLNGKIFCMNEVLGYWRHHEKQITTIMISQMFESMKYPLNFFKNLNEEQKKSFKIKIKDLIHYDLTQIKYNILYPIDNNKRKDNEQKKKKVSRRSMIKILLLKIYYNLKLNKEWIIELILRS